MIENNFNYNNQFVVMTKSDLIAALNEIAQSLIEEREGTETSSHPEEEFLSRKQVLECLGINSSTLWRWEKDQYLVGQTVGTRLKKYKKSDVLAILNGGTPKNEPPRIASYNNEKTLIL